MEEGGFEERRARFAQKKNRGQSQRAAWKALENSAGSSWAGSPGTTAHRLWWGPVPADCLIPDQIQTSAPNARSFSSAPGDHQSRVMPLQHRSLKKLPHFYEAGLGCETLPEFYYFLNRHGLMSFHGQLNLQRIRLRSMMREGILQHVDILASLPGIFFLFPCTNFFLLTSTPQFRT